METKTGKKVGLLLRGQNPTAASACSTASARRQEFTRARQAVASRGCEAQVAAQGPHSGHGGRVLFGVQMLVSLKETKAHQQTKDNFLTRSADFLITVDWLKKRKLCVYQRNGPPKKYKVRKLRQ